LVIQVILKLLSVVLRERR